MKVIEDALMGAALTTFVMGVGLVLIIGALWVTQYLADKYYDKLYKRN